MNMRAIRFLCAIVLVSGFTACGGGGGGGGGSGAGVAASQNVIQLENAKTENDGVTDAWYVSAASHAIEGYASAASVNRGQSISLYVDTADPSYAISVYRLGWYGGKGGRQVAGPIVRSGHSQPNCPLDPSVGLVECDWTDPYVLDVPSSADPTEWASGIYLAKLTASSGKESYITFTVRDDARKAALLFQQSVTTYAAYNDWGGYSLYVGKNGTAARKVSLNRPFNRNSGAGDLLTWEIKALRFLEREGYDVQYVTNMDVHANPSGLLAHKAFLSVGHDEYWTKDMRNAVEAARAAGVNLAFLGSNVGYWQIRLEQNSAGTQSNRTIVSYKDSASTSDPLYTTSPSDATVRFREAPVNRPEASLVGVMYDYSPLDQDMVISDCSTLAWICNKSGLQAGSVLTGMLGYEVDRIATSSPSGITVIAASPYVVSGKTRYSNMTYYTHGSGAGVFATGSMQWNWGLDGFGVSADRVNAGVQQITRNVLARFSGR
jgi:hypothetical protein